MQGDVMAKQILSALRRWRMRQADSGLEISWPERLPLEPQLFEIAAIERLGNHQFLVVDAA